MTNELSSFIEDLRQFECWMLEQEQLSPKVTKDIKSRVKRVKTNICPDLEQLVSSHDGYIQVFDEIKSYAQGNTKTVASCYSLTGTLRAAVKKYVRYKHPELSNDLPYARGNLMKRLHRQSE